MSASANFVFRKYVIGIWVVTIIVRLMLTAHRDILAENQPIDSYWFVLTAKNWIWGGQYTWLSFAQLPIYALWLKCLSLLGIPARLAIDAAWVFSSAYLGFAVINLCRRLWPGVVVYLFLCFHPYSIALFDRALSESLLDVFSALMLAGFIEVWNLRDVTRGKRRLLATILSALIFALAYHTRKEGVVFLPPLAVICVASLFYRDKWWSHEMRFRMGFPLIVYPLLATVIIGLLLSGANYLRWGVFTRYELNAPGYVSAMQSLNAIDTGAPTPKHVTITALTREKAYELSPTFRELKPHFEGQAGYGWASFSDVPGEIANGWFYWAIRDMAVRAGWHVDAKTAEKKYADMSGEIEKAFAEGRLKKRSVYISFLDPDWLKWLPDVKSAFLQECLRVFDVGAAPDLLGNWPEDASPGQYDDYVYITGRRNAPKQVFLSGWLILPEFTIIGLGNDKRTFVMQRLEGAPRPEIPGAISFTLRSQSDLPATQLLLNLPDGRRSQLNLAEVKLGEIHPIEGLPGAALGVENIQLNGKSGYVNHWLPTLINVWSSIGRVFFCAGLLAVIFLWRRVNRVNYGAISLIFLLSLLSILARAGLLAILDASSWNALQTRYVFPVVPHFAVFGVLGLWILISQITKHEKQH